MSLPDISVLVIAYNHEKYIKECLNSILEQNYPGNVQVVIGEDGSTDRTRDAIRDTTVVPPPNFEINLLEDIGNIGMMQNFARTYAACKYDFVAICEGDDFWIDKNKLQKQVDFLHSNPEFTICHHQVLVERNGKLEKDSITRTVESTTDFQELCKGNFIHTPSVVFRKQVDNLPEWFVDSKVGDYVLHLYNTKDGGKIKKLPIKAAVYRVHEGGAWSDIEQEKKLKSIISYHQVLLGKFGDAADQSFKLRLAECNLALYQLLSKKGEEEQAEKHMTEAKQHMGIEELIGLQAEKEFASKRGLSHLWLNLKKRIKKAFNG